MKISIFGLGYVGSVSLGCLARDGHQVIGVDVDQTKLDIIQKGLSPIIEEGMEELMSNAAKSGRVEVTSDTHAAISNSELSFVCVGTPSRANGSQDLAAVQKVSEQIGAALKEKDGFHTVVIRSTVVPGTVETLVYEGLEGSSGKQAGKDFGVCFQPEFLREGSSIKDYDHPPFTVVGGDSERSLQALQSLFGHLPGEFITTSIRSAEMLKTCCNVFHALKITFTNEVGRICQSLEVDSNEVMDLICQDRQLNISTAYMRPGFAFGGSCLPKDLRALMHIAKSHDVDVPMLSGVLPSNQLHIDHAFDMVMSSGKRSIGMIGLSFKSGTDDLRESPLVTLAEKLIGKGMDLKIYDPEVNVARLIGANRRYIEETIPHIASLMQENCADVVKNSDVVIVGLGDKSIMHEIPDLLRENHLTIDLVGMPERETLKGEYRGACW